MPLLILPILLLLVIFTVAALIPLSLVQRYRLGTSRQRARGWLVTINVAGLVLSAILFITSAAATSFWVPGALTYARVDWLPAPSWESSAFGSRSGNHHPPLFTTHRTACWCSGSC